MFNLARAASAQRSTPFGFKPLARLTLVGVLAVGALPASALDAYPSRPIRVLVGFPAGGTNDVVTRLVTNAIEKKTGWHFVVENRTGAGSNVAMEALAAAAPDGYTILVNTPGVVINPSLYSKVRYQWDKFEPIGLIGEAPLVLLANPKLPVHDIAGLQAHAKTQPDTLKFASSGNGSSSHLAMDLLRSMSNLNYLHVPYRGSGQAMADTMAGLTDLTMQPITNGLEPIRSGRLKALAQTGQSRAAVLRDVPTMAESGVRNYAVSTWYVALAPEKTPKVVTSRLQAALDNALRTPELQAQLEQVGVQALFGGSAEASRLMHQEYAKWSKLISAIGTRVD
ncbi:Bug family tripartite tricarboxylate transporter substrate binding protein [Pigmentiphaga kullae]|uniref:Tripartite-type tricarboxylate transporter receptor subunit TctC n=1 Tax=Pigmentiphaga kullae TaxID=151784 RepID=A0A4Q7NND5_9BURK|nr:tripartite tricarboxylate transporter substrate-binding protein [Pigmentiphaga kullae]RZS86663.1 tripartite-type tricarboxylate transporter receptor subunit TctC [Pigmentiphaga kullae]